MAVNRDVTDQIKDLLKGHPEGVSITDIVKVVPVNRNTASRYLDTLLVTGQVEMRHFGMAKLYSLTRRLPVSSVLSLSTEYVIQIDHSLRIIFINAPFLGLLDLSERDVVAKKIDYTRIPAIFDDEYSRLLRWISEGLSGVGRSGEIHLTAKRRTLSCRVTPVVFPDGQKGVSVLFEDITARKLDGERIRESEERYRTLVEISPDAIILHRAGIVIYANPAAIRLFGATRADEILGKNILDYVQPEFQAAVRRNIRYDLKGETTPAMEMQMLRLDGGPITVEGRGVRAFIDGEPAIQVALQDITERKLAETALQKSESHLRSIIRAAPVGIGLVVNRTILEANDRLCTITGYPAAELIGKSARILYPTDEEFDVVGTDKYSQIAKAGSGSVETRWRRKDGTIINILLSSSPLDPDDLSMGVTFTATDISGQKQTEADLREREHQYRFIVENSLDIINIQSPANILTFVSPAVTPILGYAESEVIGKPMLELVHPDDIGRIQKDILGIITKGASKVISTFRFRHKDGRYLWFESTTNVICDEKTGQIREFLSISRDITSRNQGTDNTDPTAKKRDLE
jgi:PAS domain S-box-containing protein